MKQILYVDPYILEQITPDLKDSINIFIDLPDADHMFSMAKLTKEEILILTNIDINGYTYQYVANLLNHSKSTIFRRRQKALNKLKNCKKINKIYETYKELM